LLGTCLVHRFYVVKLGYAELFLHLFKYLPGAIVVIILCSFVYPFLRQWLGSGSLAELVSLLSVIGLAAIAYFGLGHLLKLPESTKVTRRFLKK
jgi:hypothetical protein